MFLHACIPAGAGDALVQAYLNILMTGKTVETGQTELSNRFSGFLDEIPAGDPHMAACFCGCLGALHSSLQQHAIQKERNPEYKG